MLTDVNIFQLTDSVLFTFACAAVDLIVLDHVNSKLELSCLSCC